MRIDLLHTRFVSISRHLQELGQSVVHRPEAAPSQHHVDRTGFSDISDCAGVRCAQHTGPLQPPDPHCFPVWRRRRHPWPRVLQRLPLLRRLFLPHQRPLLWRPRRQRPQRPARRRQARQPHRHGRLLPQPLRLLGRRHLQRPRWLHPHVDALLWSGAGVSAVRFGGTAFLFRCGHFLALGGLLEEEKSAVDPGLDAVAVAP